MNSHLLNHMTIYSRPLVLEHRPIVFEETDYTGGQFSPWSLEPEGNDRVALGHPLNDILVHKNQSNWRGDS